MNFFDPNPSFTVPDGEFKRLLGFPPHYELGEHVKNLAGWARDWFAAKGRPWVFSRRVDSLTLLDQGVDVEGVQLNGPALRERLAKAGATTGVLVAVCAGEEAEREARQLWESERPDEYYFLETFASAVVEQLSAAVGARLCSEAEGDGLQVLPHYSPGYPGWDLSDQIPLVELLKRKDWPPGLRLDVMDSGQLIPKKSLVGLFPVAPRSAQLRQLAEMVPCENCSFHPCGFRRAPYRDAAYLGGDCRSLQSTAAKTHAGYEVNLKALERWASERLTVAAGPNGTWKAQFRFDGSTCMNGGLALAFQYSVLLGSRENGYPIIEATCAPIDGHSGFKHMCSFQQNPNAQLPAIAAPPPVLGWTLDAALGWKPEVLQSGCLCSEADRNHKWRLVLQTLHYRLNSAHPSS